MQLRQHRSPRRLVGVTLVAVAALSSCGFDYATDRYYTPANGANDRSGDVDVLSAAVVSAEEGSGVFIASLVNASGSETVTLERLSSPDEGSVSAPDLPPIEVAPRELVNLATSDTPVEVTGDFVAGDFVEVSLSFSNGETASVDVPVVPNCGYRSSVTGLPEGDPECPVTEQSDHSENE